MYLITWPPSAENKSHKWKGKFFLMCTCYFSDMIFLCRDSQEVPTTPQLDLADYDLSLHFSQTTSPKNTSKRSQSKSSHKGTLLCPPELSCQGSVISKGGEFRSEEPFIQPLSVSTEMEEGETSLECGASSLLDQVEAERPFQFAQVVSLV